jgi:hypothetical protein
VRYDDDYTKQYRAEDSYNPANCIMGKDEEDRVMAAFDESISASSISPFRASFFVNFVSPSASTLIESFSVALNDESTPSLYR